MIERGQETALLGGSSLHIAFQESIEPITFSQMDPANQVVNGKRPLYVMATLGTSQLKTALVNTSAYVNVIPFPTLNTLGIPRDRIIREPLLVF